jgi:hypothetical protein
MLDATQQGYNSRQKNDPNVVIYTLSLASEKLRDSNVSDAL